MRNKWLIWWTIFGAFVIAFIIYIIRHISKNDFNSALLQFGSILIPLFAAIIIMLQNNEQIDKSTRIQLDYLQKLNDREIEEMQRLFQRQIDTLTDSTSRQIEEFRKMTNEQIRILQENTGKQIQSNTEQTQKIVDELTDNSVLLGEILKRELEKALQQNAQELQKAKQVLEDLKGFKIGRTDADKVNQISQQSKFIQWLEDRKGKLSRKYTALSNIFQDEI